MSEYVIYFPAVSILIMFVFGAFMRSISKRLETLEKESVSDALLEAKLNTIEEKIKSVTVNIERSGNANKEDHKILFRVLEDIKDCVTKLAAGKTEC